MTERTRGRLGVAALCVLALLVQATLASDARVRGVSPDLLEVLAVCAGLGGGARQGALVGFATGLLADLYASTTPVGLEALTLCLVGYAVGTLREHVLPEGRVLTPLLALLAGGAGVVAFVALGDLVGQSQLLLPGRSALIRTAVVEGAWSAVLALPVTWAYAKVARGTRGVQELERGVVVGR